MLHLVSLAVNPDLSLLRCWKNWYQISLDLREPPRKRLLQLDNLKAILKNNTILS